MLMTPSTDMPFVLHGFHKGASPVQVLDKPFASHLCTLREDKSLAERATSLRLFKLVDEATLPPALVAARDAAHAARVARDAAYAARVASNAAAAVRDKDENVWGKACAVWSKSYNALFLSLVEHQPALLALHAATCPDCPWDGGIK